MDKYEDLLPSPWECLMENLVERDLVPILNQQGIEIAYTATHAKQRGRGDDFEYDIIAAKARLARNRADRQPPPPHIKYHNQSTQFYHLTTHSCELIR